MNVRSRRHRATFEPDNLQIDLNDGSFFGRDKKVRRMGSVYDSADLTIERAATACRSAFFSIPLQQTNLLRTLKDCLSPSDEWLIDHAPIQCECT